MLFPTKLTSLTNTRGLIDNAFFVAVYTNYMFISYTAIMKFNSSQNFVCFIWISSELDMFAYENLCRELVCITVKWTWYNGRDKFFHITSGRINTWKGVNQLKELFF